MRPSIHTYLGVVVGRVEKKCLIPHTACTEGDSVFPGSDIVPLTPFLFFFLFSPFQVSVFGILWGAASVAASDAINLRSIFQKGATCVCLP